jgi:hypothetical protein
MLFSVYLTQGSRYQRPRLPAAKRRVAAAAALQ